MNAVAITLHGLLATLWVGGMFFAYVVLRPSVAVLEPPQRLALFEGVFKRFFPWVWMAVLLMPVSGYWLVFKALGGFGSSPLHVHVMHLLGLIMIGLFLYLYGVPYRRFRRYCASGQLAPAAEALDGVRKIILANLIIGIVLISVVYAGRYGLF